MFVFGVISIEVWPTEFPVWAFVLSLVICTSGASSVSLTFCGLTSLCSFRLYYPYWHDPGYHKSASWTERYHRTYHRLRFTRTAGCNDDVQDLGLHHHGTSLNIRLRLQARTLHEGSSKTTIYSLYQSNLADLSNSDSPTPNVLGSDRRHSGRWNGPTGRSSVDVHKHRRHV